MVLRPQVCKFQLADGEMAFLTGRSGAGKSTLLSLSLFQRDQPQERFCYGLNPG